MDDEIPQNLTNSGLIMGSPLYMSPEQCRGLVIDERSDIYSLGCLMYETISGKAPFHGINAFDTMTMHVEQDAIALPSTVCSPQLWRIIQYCLCKNRDERISSAERLSEALGMLG